MSKPSLKKQLESLMQAAAEVGAGSMCIDVMAQTHRDRMFRIKDEILAEFDAPEDGPGEPACYTTAKYIERIEAASIGQGLSIRVSPSAHVMPEPVIPLYRTPETAQTERAGGPEPCEDCGGSGTYGKNGMGKCLRCEGTGDEL